MNGEIDLGVNRKEQYGVLAEPQTSPQEMNKIEYPRLHISGPKELDLPDSGEMEVKFRKVSESSSKRQDGSSWYECCLEVQCICEVESDEPKSPTSKDTSASDALDTLAKALQEKNEAD